MPRFPCWEIAPSLRRTWAAKVAFFGERPTAFPSSRLVNGTGSPGGQELAVLLGGSAPTPPPAGRPAACQSGVETALFVPAPPVEQAVLLHLQQQDAQPQVGVEQQLPQLVQLRQDRARRGLEGAFVGGGHLPLLSEPGHGLFGGDGVHHCHRPLGQKTPGAWAAAAGRSESAPLGCPLVVTASAT